SRDSTRRLAPVSSHLPQPAGAQEADQRAGAQTGRARGTTAGMGQPLRTLSRALAGAAGAILFCAVTALAQEPMTAAPTSAEFMSRFDFRMWAAALAYDDPRFVWGTHWAGDFDLVDYVYGRATFVADYQALLGNEYRPFDPYQSNYLLEAAGSIRFPQVEMFVVLNHVSRHLGDRPKRIAVAENSLGPRFLR